MLYGRENPVEGVFKAGRFQYGRKDQVEGVFKVGHLKTGEQGLIRCVLCCPPAFSR